uniref:Uncharacterized protein n=1 Tax=Chaetophora lobata TaxID=1249516 RepID=A0A7U1AQ10_9CHLO|nr:hypothetical protein [Chaetophora lobata]
MNEEKKSSFDESEPEEKPIPSEVFEKPVFTIDDWSVQKTFTQYKAWAKVNKNKEFVNFETFAKENPAIFPFSILLLQNVFLLYGIPDEHYTFKKGYNFDNTPSDVVWIDTVRKDTIGLVLSVFFLNLANRYAFMLGQLSDGLESLAISDNPIWDVLRESDDDYYNNSVRRLLDDYFYPQDYE